MDKKILKNKFKWIPMHERLDKIGLPVPPRPVDSRIPKLWLTKPLLNQDDFATEAYDVYLVNSSDSTLESVIVDSGGLLYDDDDLITTSQKDDIEYYNVENGDAVNQLSSQMYQRQNRDVKR